MILDLNMKDVERDGEYDTSVDFHFDPENFTVDINISPGEAPNDILLTLTEDEVMNLANWLYVCKKKIIGRP